jgi:hypothetical protein
MLPRLLLGPHASESSPRHCPSLQAALRQACNLLQGPIAPSSPTRARRGIASAAAAPTLTSTPIRVIPSQTRAAAARAQQQVHPPTARQQQTRGRTATPVPPPRFARRPGPAYRAAAWLGSCTLPLPDCRCRCRTASATESLQLQQPPCSMAPALISPGLHCSPPSPPPGSRRSYRPMLPCLSMT